MCRWKRFTDLSWNFQVVHRESLRKHTDPSKESSDAHRKILQAVEQRDVPGAITAVEESMEVWEYLVFKQQ